MKVYVKHRRQRGRPKSGRPLNNLPMKVNIELKELLAAEKADNESLADCALRLIRDARKKVIALKRLLEDIGTPPTEGTRRHKEVNLVAETRS